ncbi:MAG: hypothetical protein [Malazfec virus 2]
MDKQKISTEALKENVKKYEIEAIEQTNVHDKLNYYVKLKNERGEKVVIAVGEKTYKAVANLTKEV